MIDSQNGYHGRVYCPRCKAPLPARMMQVTCRECVRQDYLKHLKKIERERVLHSTPEVLRFELARDQWKRRHLVFAADSWMSYCGQAVTEPLKKRSKIDRNTLPPDVCDGCRTESDSIWAGEPAVQGGTA